MFSIGMGSRDDGTGTPGPASGVADGCPASRHPDIDDCTQPVEDVSFQAPSGGSGDGDGDVGDDVPSQAVVAAPAARIVTLSAPLTTLLAAQYANAAEHMLLGKLHGRNRPSTRELSSWCKKHLHASFLQMTSLGHGYFEVTFSSPAGKDQTLRRSGFLLSDFEVVFSPWQPSFEPENPDCVNAFSYAIWAQFCGLNSLLRTKECLTEIGKHIGEVLTVEEDDTNRAQTAGLRVRILVSTKDLNSLPKRVTIPQIGIYGGKTCKVVYSGLPEKCIPCDTYAHSPKNCPASLKPGGDHQMAQMALNSHPDVTTQGSYFTTEKSKSALKPLSWHRQTSDRNVNFQQNHCFTDPQVETTDLHNWDDHNGEVLYSNKALATSVNSQYTMTLSGPLSMPHSPTHLSQKGVESRWASSCAGITAMSSKFSSRPVYLTS